MTEFTNNNVKNASIGRIPFELNCGYYSYISFKDDANPHSRSYLAEDLAKELRNLISNCGQNLFYVQEL